MEELKLFCSGGGCTAKLGAGVLERVLSRLPKGEKDEHLLVGYDSSDDAAVYQVSEDLAIVQTLDFFPPMVEDPYTFGKIAATNAVSDIYAMGGEVRTALNIVCFPEKMDLNILGEIMRGGADVVQAAGGSLVGGHSIADSGVKYGLSVMGTVAPKKMWANNTGRIGDVLILTKTLGVGIICTANRVQEASPQAMRKAIASMTTLNKKASELCHEEEIHACTDVTGFGFLGHLHEMMNGERSCIIEADRIPVFPEALEYAEEFLTTAGGQRNRNHVGKNVRFENVSFGMEEVLFDPQTAGGLLIAVAPEAGARLVQKMQEAGLPASIVGKIVPKGESEITVCGTPSVPAEKNESETKENEQ